MTWRARYRNVRLSGFWTGLALGISAVLAVQVALGAGDVVLSGCRNDATGVIRLLPSKLPAPLDTKCNTSTNPLLHETAISWNETGPQGAKGDNGAAGASGPTGATGSNGAQGPKGDSGANGATGPTGATGLTGPTGPQGAHGETGAVGASGAVGDTGLAGANGATGATGPSGPKGDSGAAGPPGAGGAPASLNSLIGIACNTGTALGTLTVSYGPPPNETVTLICVATVTFPLNVTFAISGAAQGTVTSAPAGLSCAATCSANFASGTGVTLTASPASGSRFMGWTGACSGASTCTVAMNASTSVGATFAPGWYLTVTVGADGSYSFTCNVFGTCYHDPGGRVTSVPIGIDCAVGPSQSKTCTANFAPDTSVALTIDPFNGHATWGGDCAGQATGTCTLSMNSSKTVTAHFD